MYRSSQVSSSRLLRRQSLKYSSEYIWYKTNEVFRLFSVTLSINDAVEIIMTEPREVIDIPVSDLSSTLSFVRIYESSVDKVSTDFPCIVAYPFPQIYKGMLIDGYHRLVKARRQGLEKLPCVVLTRRETDSIMY